MIDEKLPNISIIKIQVNTKFKPQIVDGEDFKTEMIKRFHDAIHTYIEQCLTENEVLEFEIMEIMQDDWLPEKVTEFSDFGEISIQVIEEQSVEIKQINLDDDEIKIYKSLPKSQTKLGGF